MKQKVLEPGIPIRLARPGLRFKISCLHNAQQHTLMPSDQNIKEPSLWFE